jgi:hypothetical protein
MKRIGSVPLPHRELRYTSVELLDFGAGGQIYGTMEGTLAGDRLRGRLRLTNLAQRRPDGVNTPALRGMLDTDDGVSIYVEMNGIAQLRATDQARVFATSFTFRTGDPRYAWLNSTFAVLEGVLDSITVGGVARGSAYVRQPLWPDFVGDEPRGVPGSEAVTAHHRQVRTGICFGSGVVCFGRKSRAGEKDLRVPKQTNSGHRG